MSEFKPLFDEVMAMIGRFTADLPASVTVTERQRNLLLLAYGDLTVKELRDRCTGRGFRRATANSYNKADLIEQMINFYGWDNRLVGTDWEIRYAKNFEQMVSAP